MNWSQLGALATLVALGALYLPQRLAPAHGAVDLFAVVGIVLLWLRVRKYRRWA